MSREANYTAIILKKQPFNEADEIITFFSRQTGKIRGLAKSVKLPKARLQNALQSLFAVEVTLVNRGNLPQIIAAEPQKTFARLRHQLDLLKLGLYAVELVLRFTPDGQKNEPLFDLLYDFLNYLDTDGRQQEVSLAKFKAQFLVTVGLSASAHEDLGTESDRLKLCQTLENISFTELNYTTWPDIAPLQRFLSDFIVYHLDREVKSERFLQNMV